MILDFRIISRQKSSQLLITQALWNKNEILVLELLKSRHTYTQTDSEMVGNDFSARFRKY